MKGSIAQKMPSMINLAVLRVSNSLNGIEYDLQLPGAEGCGPIRYASTHSVGEADLAAIQTLSAELFHAPVSESFSRDARLIGEKLHTTLIPQDLGKALASLSTPLLVSTPRSSLPCELFYADEFWGLRYAIGKQIRMDLPTRLAQPVPHLKRLRALVICSDPRSDLDFVDSEAERVLACLQRAGADIYVVGSSEATVDMVRRQLANAYDIIHYCGHVVRVGTDNSDLPGLLLADERILSSEEIRNGLDGSPVVFLNGCATARNGQSALRSIWGEEDISSVAYGFIRGGASAVVATVSEISDEHAAEVAVSFFDEALAGATLGEALRLARVHVRSLAPDSPTWMSFVLYGNPADVLVELTTHAKPVPNVKTERRFRRPMLIVSIVAIIVLCAFALLWTYATSWPYHELRYRQSFDDATDVERFWTPQGTPWRTDPANGWHCATKYAPNEADYVWIGGSHLDFSDAPISANVRLTGMDDQAKAGLLYRYNRSTQNYYALVVSANGNWEFLKRIDGGLHIEAAHVASGEITSTKNEGFVELAVVGTGPRIDIYVDGYKARSIQDYQLLTGDIGIIAIGTGMFCLDDFAVHKKW